MRKIIAIINVDDDMAIAQDMGTIEYIEHEFGWLRDSGISLENARILDDDDIEDRDAIRAVGQIFDSF